MIFFVMSLVFIFTGILDVTFIYNLSKSKNLKINARSIVCQTIGVYLVIITTTMFFAACSHDLFRSYVFTGCEYLAVGGIFHMLNDGPVNQNHPKTNVFVGTLCAIDGCIILATSAVGFVIYLAYHTIFN